MALLYPPLVNGLQKSLGAQLDEGTVSSVTLNNTTSIQNKPGVILIDRIDTSGTEKDAAVREYIAYTAVSGSTLTGLTRAQGGSTDQDHAIGAIVEFVSDVTQQQAIIDAIVAEHSEAGVHSETALDSMIAGTEAQGDIIYHNGTIWTRLAAGTSGHFLKTLGSSANPVWAEASILSTSLYPQRGFMINGFILPSVTSNNLTLALKGLDGNNPSASNPVYVRIGNNVRTVTSALSVTKNAGTNWCNSGGVELAAQEVDYFAYLGYNATDGVVIGFSRIPYARRYDDFSTTSTDEKYCAISTITNAAATDYYEVIGRFAATLSGGAGYTWTVPTYTALNLIQQPCYETRTLLMATATISYDGGGGSNLTAQATNLYYKIRDAMCWYRFAVQASHTLSAGTGTYQFSLPIVGMTEAGGYAMRFNVRFTDVSDANRVFPCIGSVSSAATTLRCAVCSQDAAAAPPAIALDDWIEGVIEYPIT